MQAHDWCLIFFFYLFISSIRPQLWKPSATGWWLLENPAGQQQATEIFQLARCYRLIWEIPSARESSAPFEWSHQVSGTSIPDTSSSEPEQEAPGDASLRVRQVSACQVRKGEAEGEMKT